MLKSPEISSLLSCHWTSHNYVIASKITTSYCKNVDRFYGLHQNKLPYRMASSPISILNDSICNYPLSFQSRSPWFESRLYSNLEMAHIRVDTQNPDPKQFKSFCCFQVAVYLETILKHLLLKNILSALLAIYDITVREYTISVSLMCYRIPAVRLQ